MIETLEINNNNEKEEAGGKEEGIIANLLDIIVLHLLL